MAEKHIVIFPFMAQGHITPLLAFALHLQQTLPRTYTITIINTPLNISKLSSSLPPTSSINLIEIPFDSSDHNLPPNTENTDTLSYPLIIKLLEASASLKPAFVDILKGLLRDQEVLCIVADTFFGWTVSVAKELGVFHVFFTSGGFGSACYYSICLTLPHRRTLDCDEFELDDFEEAGKIHVSQLPLNILEADGTDAWSVFHSKNLASQKDTDGILFNTIEGFDEIGLSYFRRKLGKAAWAIGPILLSTKNTEGKSSVDSIKIMGWLNTKPEKSVLYIAFGSNNTISLSQMKQLATALENLDRNFIWVVRPPLGFDINREFDANEWLPEGFEKRIRESNRGLLVQKWAPQVEILSHKSVCAFLSHCGWNSVLEALSKGVPLLGWALAAEQFFNVTYLEERLGVCLEIARGMTCEVKHGEMEEKIETVMYETEKSKEIRRNVLKVKEMIEDAVKDGDGYKGSSVKALEDFFQAAMVMSKSQDY